jgi:SynChlorMet cassette protein ScmD
LGRVCFLQNNQEPIDLIVDRIDACQTGSAPTVSSVNGWDSDFRGKEIAVDTRNALANPLIVLREEFDDWAILFDPDTGNAFGLNPTGVFVWKLLDGRHGVEEIVKGLQGEADDVPEDAMEHVRQFIVSLETQGLVGYEISNP